jgi:hypothetical protein
MQQETTGTVLPGATPTPKPPRRGLSFKTFCTLDGITPAIIADMNRVLRGDGYDKATRKTYAFMTRHNVEYVSLDGPDRELGR